MVIHVVVDISNMHASVHFTASLITMTKCFKSKIHIRKTRNEMKKKTKDNGYGRRRRQKKLLSYIHIYVCVPKSIFSRVIGCERKANIQLHMYVCISIYMQFFLHILVYIYRQKKNHFNNVCTNLLCVVNMHIYIRIYRAVYMKD